MLLPSSVLVTVALAILKWEGLLEVHEAAGDAPDRGQDQRSAVSGQGGAELIGDHCFAQPEYRSRYG